MIAATSLAPRSLLKPACSLTSTASKPAVLAASMARSFCSRAGEWQYSSACCPCSSSTRWILIVTLPADCTSESQRGNPLPSSAMASQRHQRAVAAALLAVAAFGLTHPCSDALEVDVGQVVQGDSLAEAEDRLRLTEQVVLQGLAVLVVRVLGPVNGCQEALFSGCEGADEGRKAINCAA